MASRKGRYSAAVQDCLFLKRLGPFLKVDRPTRSRKQAPLFRWRLPKDPPMRDLPLSGSERINIHRVYRFSQSSRESAVIMAPQAAPMDGFDWLNFTKQFCRHINPFDTFARGYRLIASNQIDRAIFVRYTDFGYSTFYGKAYLVSSPVPNSKLCEVVKITVSPSEIHLFGSAVARNKGIRRTMTWRM